MVNLYMEFFQNRTSVRLRLTGYDLNDIKTVSSDHDTLLTLWRHFINGIFFNPKGIALIGATAHTAKGGFSILTNLLKGFGGKIYPVNPRYPSIGGLTCHPRVLDVPDPVDLAIVFVPAPQVPMPFANVRCATFPVL
jgi:hypothetical protein